MLEKLNPKDVRALKLGAAAIAAMILLLFALDLKECWTKEKTSFEETKSKLDTLAAIEMTEVEYARLMSTVPAFKIPAAKGDQKFLFQDSLNEQLKKANINSQPWQEIGGKLTLSTGHEVLRLKTSGKCNITQLFDLLANLNESPYLIGIEEIMIKRDTQNQQQVNFDITVSTPVKSSKGLL
jgi:hypothetical protein